MVLQGRHSTRDQKSEFPLKLSLPHLFPPTLTSSHAGVGQGGKEWRGTEGRPTGAGSTELDH